MFSMRTPAGRGGKASPYVQSPSRSSVNLSNSTPRRSLRRQPNLTGLTMQSTQLLEETSQHRIEAFGAPLPVLITEALNLSDRSTTEITACVEPSGWAWLVGGRKLFVWRYKSTSNSRMVQCKELMLPPSDLAHSAERVCLIPSENDGQPAACIAVSPEGIVRYWPNIAFESSTAEISAELRGEECAKVINFHPHGCLLATTTSSLLLLEPATGQVSIQCKPLKASQGLFSGLSKRMSSFIFGASPLQTNGSPLQTILAAPEDEYDDDDDEGEDRRSFYVLSGNNLSKWQVPSIGQEKLLYQIDADRMFREGLARKVWEQDSIQMPQLKTWLLDLQLTRDGIVMLGAGLNLEAAHVVYYALAYFETYEDAQPTSISDLMLLDYTQKYTDELEDHVTECKLLLPYDSSNVVFIYNANSILMLHDNHSKLDKMDFKTVGDCILGAGRSDGVAVFLSNSHGMFSVSPPSTDLSMLDESNNHGLSISRTELSSMAMNISKMAELTQSDDNKMKLKGAFIASLSGDQGQALSTVEEVLLLIRQDPGDQGSELDTLVAGISRDLIDDYPNADPRWAESNKQDSTSTASVIITQQLKDKQKAHDVFISFLKMYGLWNKLGVVNIRESVMPTHLLLCEHVEKLEAALALRELHSEHHKIVDACIRKVLKQRQVVVPSSLTSQDMFYREVSNIQDFTESLLSWEKDFLASDQTSQNIASTVLAINTILQCLLHQALRYRQTHSDMYVGAGENIPEYIPWSATNSMRKIIIEQIGISLQRGVSECREIDVQGVLFQNIVGLADIVMDGYASQLKSLQSHQDRDDDYTKLEKEFEKERHRIITMLLERRQFDRAASLAEKFEDFEMLMRICDTTSNHERLQRYHVHYADKGFAQFMFSWYTKEGKRGHLLAQSVAQGEELSKFLDSDNMKYLSWLHEIKRGNYFSAYTTLAELASKEKNFVSKKKTLLSLSKLSALCCEDSLQDNIDEINDELDLILHQELLPTETLENVGMDPGNMRVLSPEELIELYIGEKNTRPSELDVKKALDLLRYISRESDHAAYEALKLHIWCRAILMDSWIDDDDEGEPLESNRSKIFFKAVDLVYLDNELESLLPDLDQLLEEKQLGDLRKEPKFEFFMKGGFEQIRNSMSMME